MEKYSFILFLLFATCSGCKEKENISVAESSKQLVNNIYDQCSGNTFYPIDTCLIPTGLATTVFNEWKNQFKAQHGLSDSVFNSRIKLSAVELSQGPLYVFLRIDYVFVVDWVRSRQAVSIKLGTYPLAQDPSDSAISHAVHIEIRETDQINLNGVVSRALAENVLLSCNSSMQPEWCEIRFENVTGRLLLLGYCVIDYNANICKGSAVYLSNGNLAYCAEGPCWIN